MQATGSKTHDSTRMIETEIERIVYEWLEARMIENVWKWYESEKRARMQEVLKNARSE
jgi:hypothetical protein